MDVVSSGYGRMVIFILFRVIGGHSESLWYYMQGMYLCPELGICNDIPGGSVFRNLYLPFGGSITTNQEGSDLESEGLLSRIPSNPVLADI